MMTDEEDTTTTGGFVVIDEEELTNMEEADEGTDRNDDHDDHHLHQHDLEDNNDDDGDDVEMDGLLTSIDGETDPSRSDRRHKRRRNGGKYYDGTAITETSSSSSSSLVIFVVVVMTMIVAIFVVALFVVDKNQLGLKNIGNGDSDSSNLNKTTTTTNNNSTQPTSSTSSSSSKATFLQPPVARRDEDRVFYAGVLPPSSSLPHNDLQRQDPNSQHKLLDPPMAVPDPYGWLRDETREDSNVLHHLTLENDYTYNVTHTSSFLRTKDTIYDRMKVLVSLDDSSFTFPVVDGDYYYYKRTIEGLSYPLHCRAPIYTNNDVNDDDDIDVDSNNPTNDGDNVDNDEGSRQRWKSHGMYLKYHLKQRPSTLSIPVLPGEIIYLDENTVGSQHEFFHVGTIQISPSQNYVAYTIDTTGSEQYYLVIQHILRHHNEYSKENEAASNDNNDSKIRHKNSTHEETDFYWEDTSTIVSDNMLWGMDDTTIYYTKMDDTQRTNSVYRRTINFVHSTNTNTNIQSGNNNDSNQGTRTRRRSLERFMTVDVNETTSTKPNSTNDVGDDSNSSYNDHVNEEEVLLFEEPDTLFWVWIGKTTDRRYLLVMISSSESSEVRYLDLESESTTITINDGSGNNTNIDDEEHQDDVLHMKVVAGRRPNVLYSVDHRHGIWWMMSTVGENVSEYQLWTGNVDEHNWKRVQDPNQQFHQPLLDGVSISDLTAFDRHVVVEGREDGMIHLWIITFDDYYDDDDTAEDYAGISIRKCERLEWDITEPAYLVELGPNVDFYSDEVIVRYESLISPVQFIEVDVHPESSSSTTPSKSKSYHLTVYISPVPGYDRNLYGCDRIHVLSRDGTTQIPVSIVYRKDIMDKATNDGEAVPLHLYAYGAYGESMEDWFSASRVALLDFGFIYAVAHVRGGGELGRKWYEDGKYLRKMNTFNDVVDVARYFINDVQWTNPSLLSCEGRSAGGLTMGASINQAPDLFHAAILGVPFVDVVATMTDASLPLTTGEWEEWGNPNEEYYFETMMSYSPMQNVQSGVQYPSILLLAGLHDPRVQYWEPAKFTQQLRYVTGSSNSSSVATIRNNNNIICLKTEMSSGHFSVSDRYKYIDSKSFDYAFVVWQLGLAS